MAIGRGDTCILRRYLFSIAVCVIYPSVDGQGRLIAEARVSKTKDHLARGAEIASAV
jgi:hypothetical protein